MAFDPIIASAAVGTGPKFAFDTFADTDAVDKVMPYGAIAFGPLNGPYVPVTDAAGFPVAQQGTWTIDLGATDNALLQAIADALAGTLTIDLPSGAASEAKQDDAITTLDSIDGKTPALGQALEAASVPVVLTAAQIATLTPPAAITGFATAANQATEIASLDSIDTSTGRIAGKYVDYDTSGGTDSVVAVGILLPSSGGAVIGGTATNPIRTDPTGSTTQPISAASLPLPTDAATQTTLANVETKLGEIDAGKLEEATFTGRLGEVQASPTANTVLGRLKDLLTGIVLAAGSNVVGWVNVITGQTGVAGGTGAVGANTLRVTIANDDQVSTSLNVMDDWDESDRCKSNIVVGQAGITAGAGAVAANTPRVTHASDDPAVTALQLIDNAVSGAGFNVTQLAGVNVTMGNGASGTGVQRVTIASDSTGQMKLAAGTAAIGSLTAGSAVIGKVGIDQTTPGTTNAVQAIAGTTGGATPYKLISAASTNATIVKASAGSLFGIQVYNLNAAARYLKLYNKASAPTVGTDTPVKVIAIPGNTAGAGSNVSIPACGVAFSTGLAFALTTGAADTDTGAVASAEIVVNLDYK